MPSARGDERKVRPILLVEDEADDVELVRYALESHHVLNPLVTVREGSTARELLAQAAPQDLPAVVLLDIYLPNNTTGLDLLDWMRLQPEPLGTLPVIMLTVSTDLTHQARASARSAMLFLFKPITADVLIEALQRLGLVLTRAVSGATAGTLVEPREP